MPARGPSATTSDGGHWTVPMATWLALVPYGTLLISQARTGTLRYLIIYMLLSPAGTLRYYVPYILYYILSAVPCGACILYNIYVSIYKAVAVHTGLTAVYCILVIGSSRTLSAAGVRTMIVRTLPPYTVLPAVHRPYSRSPRPKPAVHRPYTLWLLPSVHRCGPPTPWYFRTV